MSAQLAVALVVQRAGRVALADPGGHRGQPAPGAALVAQRPHHDAGVVLVPLDHPAGPGRAARAPSARRRPGCRASPDLAEAVGLQIALVDHPQAQLVAQVEEGRVRRIVAGADRVDVVLLHQQQIAAHRLRVQGAPVARVELMAVDAAQQDPPAVDLQQPVLDARPYGSRSAAGSARRRWPAPRRRAAAARPSRGSTGTVTLSPGRQSRGRAPGRSPGRPVRSPPAGCRGR